MSDPSPAEQLRVETRSDSAVSRTLEVEVPAPRVRAAFDRVYRNLGRSARVKGFRPGKVPRKVLERVYGPAAAEEVERALVTETLPDAVELAGLTPVSEPEIDAPPPVADAPYRYSARIEIKPQIALPALEGLPAKRPRVEVDEARIDAQIEAMREGMAPLVEAPEDAVATEGDTLEVDFEGRIDGELFEGGSGKEMRIELGAGRLVPGFEEQLMGARAGERREVRVTFPDDYGEASLRGREAVFDVTVQTIRRKQLPELDDEFAKDVGEESFEALRAKVREQLESQAEREARAALERSLMDALLERCDFEVPPGLVERELHGQMQQMRQRFEGRVPAEVLQAELARMHESGRENALRRVREALVIDAIVAQEGIEAAPEQVQARLEEIATAQGADLDTVRKAAEAQGWLDSIASEVRHARALDFLASKANVEETTDT